ncbi:hypothetical protein BD289DRAFT_47259 [Coniella lustricola]|uniref:Large ribosomal subunit protein bL32m n=1 Tax=Coniella lustricola TaxID=2025994 RepID=A0A2T3AIE1_9PEZI|nr:hypothetical protein BD289DRAFT_47259 [Coniella lustricola]
MASAMLSARATSIIPRLSSSTSFSRFASIRIIQLSLPLLPSAALAIPAITLKLPSLPSWQEVWDGLLKAVPKKKVSHSKRRHRQMAGKALKDVTSLCRCSVCGAPKRMHLLCTNCARKFAGVMTKFFQSPGKKTMTTTTIDKTQGKE